MNDTIRQKITITGLVQGIGFRPFVYNLANRLELDGFVRNCANSVEIVVQGPQVVVDTFIDTLDTSTAEPLPEKGFSILKSLDTSNEVTDISPDIAVRDHCLADMKTARR